MTQHVQLNNLYWLARELTEPHVCGRTRMQPVLTTGREGKREPFVDWVRTIETAIGRSKLLIAPKLRAHSRLAQPGEVAFAVQALNRMIRETKLVFVCRGTVWVRDCGVRTRLAAPMNSETRRNR